MLRKDNWEGPSKFESMLTAMRMIFRITGKITWKTTLKKRVFFFVIKKVVINTEASAEKVKSILGFDILSENENKLKIKINNFIFEVNVNVDF
jgi:hypothetical protein